MYSKRFSKIWNHSWAFSMLMFCKACSQADFSRNFLCSFRPNENGTNIENSENSFKNTPTRCISPKRAECRLWMSFFQMFISFLRCCQISVAGLNRLKRLAILIVHKLCLNWISEIAWQEGHKLTNSVLLELESLQNLQDISTASQKNVHRIQFWTNGSNETLPKSGGPQELCQQQRW